MLMTGITQDGAPIQADPGLCRVGRVSIEIAGRAERRIVNIVDENRQEPAAYLLLIPVSDRIAYTQNGRCGIVDFGQYVLLDKDEFYDLSAEERLLHWAVTIPRADIEGRIPSIEDHLGCRFAQNPQMASLLCEWIATIAGIFGDRAPPNPEALATEIVSLVVLVIQAEDRGAAVSARNTRYQLRKRIFNFIDEHLADPDLSPRKIAQENRISLSYLYSLFSDNQTTVGQFIQTRRLQNAYEMLVSDPRGTQTVSEIAYSVGFKNASHFSRTFSRHFRQAPRDIRQLGNAGTILRDVA